MSRTYSISELFFTSWEQLNAPQMIKLIHLRNQLQQTKKEELWGSYGYLSIQTLKLLTRNASLVGKIDVQQAVDCVNDLKFIHEPWYHFEPAGQWPMYEPPEERMHNRTFDQFIYADAEFTKFCVLDYRGKLSGKPDETQMNLAIYKLIGILYTPPKRFDSAKIHSRALSIRHWMPQEEQALVLHTFANIRQYIVKERCKNLFNVPDTDPKKETPPVYSGEMWMKLRYNLSETPTFQGMQTTKNAPLFDALDTLEQKAIEAAKQPKPAAT